jgi:hypothetical protein
VDSLKASEGELLRIERAVQRRNNAGPSWDEYVGCGDELDPSAWTQRRASVVMRPTRDRNAEIEP